jgi:uncharacterized membrane protein
MPDSPTEPQGDPRRINAQIDLKAKQVIQSLPKNLRPRVTELIQSVAYTASITQFSGPIPSPERLGQYNQVVPGSANRIIQMAETQAEHRRELENHAVRSQIRQSDCGQWMALGISLTAISASVWVTLAGQPWVGATLGGTTVVSLAGIFIVGKWQQSTDLRRRRTGQ